MGVSRMVCRSVGGRDSMKIGFFEKVIIRNSRKFPELNDRTGVVLGISEEDCVIYGYGVHVDGIDDGGYDFKSDEIIGTGEFVDRSVFYDDADRIRVRVGEDGTGHIVDGDDG